MHFYPPLTEGYFMFHMDYAEVIGSFGDSLLPKPSPAVAATNFPVSVPVTSSVVSVAT